MVDAISKPTRVFRVAVVDSAGESINWNDIDVGRAEVSSHWNRVPGRKYDLFTYTNVDEVELQLDGRSLGTQRNRRDDPELRNIIQWKAVPYAAAGKLVAIARTGGKEVARHMLETTGPAKALQIEAAGGPRQHPGLSARDRGQTDDAENPLTELRADTGRSLVES